MADHHKAQSAKQTNEAAHQRRGVEPVHQEWTRLEQADQATLQRSVANPGLARPADILALQRAYGNQTITRLIQAFAPSTALGTGRTGGTGKLRVQAKLMVGPVGDQYEQEADRVAEQVMSMPNPQTGSSQQSTVSGQPSLQRQAPEEEEVQAKPLAASITPLVRRQAEEEEKLQTKPLLQRQPEEEEEVQMKSLAASITPLVQRQEMPEEEEEELQMKPILQRQAEEEEELQAKPLAQRQADGSFEAGPEIEQRLAARKGNGSPLTEDVRAFMEPRFGADFSGVRVHTGGEAAQMNRELIAQSFTHGQDIYFGPGRYEPGSGAGKQLLAHELVHTIQQGAKNTNLARYTMGGAGRLKTTRPGLRTIKCIQRALAVSDNPVNATLPPLADVSEPGKQGVMGKVYFLRNTTGEELVIKYTDEDPKEALIETGMLEETGAEAPGTRQAQAADATSILAGIDQWAASAPPGEAAARTQRRDAINADAASKRFLLLMSKAPGKSIEKVLGESPEEFEQILSDKTFQEGLGRIIAADALSGNSDRMYAELGQDGKLTAFVHIQNLLIHKVTDQGTSKYLAVAIDNMFKPEVSRGQVGTSQFQSPYGFKFRFGAQLSYASLAAAHEQYMTQEAGALFDRFCGLVKMYKRSISDQKMDEIKGGRADFVPTVTASAVASMTKLLSKGGWKQTLTTQGASVEEKEQFGERKRYLKILSAGKTPQEAQTLLQGGAAGYKAWKAAGVAAWRPNLLALPAIPEDVRRIPAKPGSGWSFSKEKRKIQKRQKTQFYAKLNIFIGSLTGKRQATEGLLDGVRPPYTRKQAAAIKEQRGAIENMFAFYRTQKTAWTEKLDEKKDANRLRQLTEEFNAFRGKKSSLVLLSR